MAILSGATVSLYWGAFPATLEGASVVSPRGTLLPAIPGMQRVPEDQPTIQAAIDAALPGETVVVAPGFWDERIHIRGKAITLRSVAGAERTTLSGTGSSGPVIIVEGALARGTRIEGFTVSGGHGDRGHGILVEGADLAVRDSRLERNGSSGVFNDGGEVALFGCTLDSNAAPVAGGGVRAMRGDTTLVNCTVSRNTAGTFGGGIFAEGGRLQVLDTRITANRTTSGAWGGGMWAERTDVFASGSSFSGNSSIESGGAAYLRGGTADLFRCDFTGNTSEMAYGLFSEGAFVRLRESSLCGIASDAVVGDMIDMTGARFSDCYLDCNRNGMRDSDEISMGFQPDMDGNGILDACEQADPVELGWAGEQP
jgi:predicted outer membrane repeat protein